MFTKNIFILVAFVLVLLGIFFPSWYIGLPGLLLLAAFVPIGGIAAGFVYDVYFGASPFLPQVINYPFMLTALVMGIFSLFLRDHIR